MPQHDSKTVSAGPEADTGRHQFSILFDLYTAEKASNTLVDETVEPYGVADGFAAMSLIKTRGPLTPTELAQTLGMPLQTVSDLIRRLLDRGHATQQPNPKDGRSYLINLTTEGQQAHAAALPAFNDMISQVEHQLERTPDEVRATLADLEAAVRKARHARLGTHPPKRS